MDEKKDDGDKLQHTSFELGAEKANWAAVYLSGRTFA